ncbi:MAG: ATP synthase F1 subunit epsilon [Anaerolineae bacterium CG2_30_64_16]|nr:MAG: ATP synthase F1 subunit epsilon [Anaerolineae bacterium CG2_30_64_16]
MSTIRLDFVSQDHLVFSDDVNEVIAPGSEGTLGILPRHAPLMTVLGPGEVIVRREGQTELYFAVSGGWMEVRPDHVTILARTAERAEEIDLTRAEAAKARAEQLLATGAPREERVGLEMALRRSQVRLKVASHRRRGWRPSGPGVAEEFSEEG